jgi:hypothetical protein
MTKSTGLEPQQIGKDDWYYEYPTHLFLVHRKYGPDGKFMGTDTVKIYWRKIEASLKRVRRPRRRRGAQ